MRHPTTGLSEGDLSRLTGSSSSTASCASNSSASSSSSSSSSSTPSPSVTPTPTPTPSSASSPSISPSSTTNNLSHLDGHKIERNHSPEKISLKNNINTQQHKNNNTTSSATTTTTTRFNSTYLPEIINPLEWQKSRKRKDRLDSTSSATLDRKLQRSNSEELLPVDAVSADSATDVKTACYESKSGQTLRASKTTDVIRRVASEDFKRLQTATTIKDLQNLETKKDCDKQQEQQVEQEKPDSTIAKTFDENDSSWANRQNTTQAQSQPKQQQQQQQQGKHISLECWVGSNNSMPTKDMRRRTRYETSPARSQRLSPIRNGNSNNSSNSNKYRDSDDSECEHERRRSSERFCKTRAPPGRKAAGVTKKSQTNCSNNAAKYLPTKRNDENVYKYDLSALKYERRGFISKKVIQGEKNASAITATKNNNSDHNDNNLIDFHQQKPITKSPPTSSDEATANSSPSTGTTIATASVKPRAFSVPPITSAQEVLPWGRAVPEDQTPILSRRYATVRHHPGDNIDTAAKLSKVMPYPQQYHKQYSATQQLIDDMYDAIEPLNTFRGLTSLTNINSSDVMQQVLPAMISYQSPEERLKQINKRMTSLKKKLIQYEEAYETRLGFRPSQAERLNDKHMKNILAELSKLRKERHEMKTDPVSALGLKVSGNMDAGMKLEKMKSTLTEIEENLSTKRVDLHRSEILDELNADQLVQEKTAVQHGLLYFESLYGRPITKDERDAARPLYDRYRQLKRLVSRSVVLSGTVSGVPELPTILEHEAMVFEATPSLQHSSNNSTETANTPTEAVALQNTTAVSSDDSTTTTTTTNTNAVTHGAANGEGDKDYGTAASNTNCENIGLLSIEQLWEHFDRVNEEKKLLKRSIREYELIFEEQNGRKMLKNDRKTIEETYAQYKEKKAKARLLQALIKKQIQR